MNEAIINIDPRLLIPVGAVVAAFIAGVFSLINLSISQNINQCNYKQKSLDAFREEIAQFIAKLQLIINILRLEIESVDADEKSISGVIRKVLSEKSELINDITKLYNQLRLRHDLVVGFLGKRKWLHFLTTLNSAYNLLETEELFEADHVSKLIAKLFDASFEMAKKSSKGISNGTLFFRLIKTLALSLLIGSIIGGFWLW